MWSKTVARIALGAGLCAAAVVAAWSDETTSGSTNNGPVTPGQPNAFGAIWDDPWFYGDVFSLGVDTDLFTNGPTHWGDDPTIVLTSYTESGPCNLITEFWRPVMSDKTYNTQLWPPHPITMLVINATASIQSVPIVFGGVASPPPPPPESPPEEPAPPPG